MQPKLTLMPLHVAVKCHAMKCCVMIPALLVSMLSLDHTLHV